jgi:hypothetical protein
VRGLNVAPLKNATEQGTGGVRDLAEGLGTEAAFRVHQPALDFLRPRFVDNTQAVPADDLVARHDRSPAGR